LIKPREASWGSLYGRTKSAVDETNLGETVMKQLAPLPSAIANRRSLHGFVFGTAVATTILAGAAAATPSSGSLSTLIGRATFGEPFKIERLIKNESAPPRRLWWDGKQLWWDRTLNALGHNQAHPEWGVEIKAWPAVDVAVQTIVFQPGGQSGWHSHPGPVFISVVSGTMTFYDSDDPNCSPVVRTAGQGFLDTGVHAHVARNETAQPAMNVVTYFAPPTAPLRIDQPAPAHCGF
jgi:hypothetical protein